MPRILPPISDDYPVNISIWHATETSDELMKFADDSGIDLFPLKNVRLEKRKREWLLTRLLMHSYGLSVAPSFLPNGKPVLPDGRGISISHCGDYAAFAICDESVGIDLQKPDLKLLRIQSKFCNEREIKSIQEQGDILTNLTIVWSAKEAIFKYFGEKVDFAGDLTVLALESNQQFVPVEYSGLHGHYLFKVLKLNIDDHFLLSATKTT